MDTFNRYAPFIQEYIYQNNWQSLRGIQIAAADALFNTDKNVLLTASTASGKTEAAFFPILSMFYEDMPASVGAIYIGPLKALINDQFLRLNNLCAEAHIPVWHWHGDVSQSHKNKLLKHPSGILQITPESLEALLLHRHNHIPLLFGDLRFIVIDEVHSLLRGDRGGQTLCLIERLSKLAGVNPRRIGLSATIGDPEATGAFLDAGTGRGIVIPKIETAKTTWRLSMEHFRIPQVHSEKSLNSAGKKLRGPMVSILPPDTDPGLSYIYNHTRGKKCLVFVNSREECEGVTTVLRHYCERNHESDRFLIHHGNLSASYRETAEAIMKEDEKNVTTVTTSTLELGIDIGRLERAFQLNAPFTVSSFLQRMGRTGRRDLPPEMWFVMREDMPEPRAMLPATIPWALLQGIALVELYREERWVEPPKLNRLPYSLLYHQTMSTLASSGELSPRELASRVLSLHYFHRITQEDYQILLRHLIQTEHIEKTETGGLIVGLTGERQINSFKFYAVFQENEEYTVRHESQEIGTIVMPPPAGEKIALAGQVWTVDEVDYKRHLVYCTPVKGKVPAYFGQCPGDIHTKILEKMKDILSSDNAYPYLQPNAVTRLAEARLTAKHAQLVTTSLVCLGGNMWCLLPWMGTYSFLTLERFIKRKCAKTLGISELNVARPYYVQFKMNATPEAFFKTLHNEALLPLNSMDLVYPEEVPLFEKYDEFLPSELVRKGFAQGVLNVEEMKQLVLNMHI